MADKRLDFKAVSAAALNQIESLLVSWLPDGKRAGHEYIARNPTRGDAKPGSFAINLNNCKWSDFATGDKGGDAISLYAYLHGIRQMEAAKEVAAQIGFSLDPLKPAPKEKKSRTDWVPVLPVPAEAGDYPKAHIKRGRPDAHWEYRNLSGELLGLIYRFTNSDGGKEILPCVYARHPSGAAEWRWMAFPEPRPLYVPGALREGVTRLIVEGEKCADVAHRLLPDYDAATWPGGSKAVDKVDWSLFSAGDKVLLWPDCDAQTDKSGALLPASRQPGVLAMQKIAEILTAQGCKVRTLEISAPGEKPSGWDIADAVDEGMDTAALLGFIRGNQRKTESAESISTAGPATAEAWTKALFLHNGNFRECRENVYQLLLNHPEWTGCLGMDEFSNSIRARLDSPTGLKAGASWDEDQDFKLGLWMAKHLSLFIKADGMISSGVRAAAIQNSFHPVREWLDSLKWDGVSRIERWLSDFAGVSDTPYSRLVARYFIIGMVARIYRPGCKMDTALILEGLQGEGKSTIARALAGEWFSDTTFVMGDKDSFMALRGKWAYELAELDSFNRSESTRAKAFISSSVDSYRAPYDRISKDHPRQCVFIGTTNQYEYFKDASGNRRYWPVLCLGELNPAGLREMREQLFAEAVDLFHAGERWHPSKEEQINLFTPEQEQRELDDPWMIAIHDWIKYKCTDDQVTSLDILCGALKMEVSKIDGARQASMRVGVCMRKLGWGKSRRTSGLREWVYTKPKGIDDGKQVSDPIGSAFGGEDEPF